MIRDRAVPCRAGPRAAVAALARDLAALLLALGAAGACVDFVAPEDPPAVDPAIYVAIQAHHADSLQAQVMVRIDGLESVWPQADGVPIPRLEGDSGAVRYYGGRVPVDPSAPAVRITAPGSGLDLSVPVVARTASASWNGADELVLPVVDEPLRTPEEAAHWSLAVSDSAGRALILLSSPSDMPDPLVVPRSMLPGVPARATLDRRRTAELETTTPRTAISVVSVVEFAVPPPAGDSARGADDGSGGGS